MSTTAKPSPTHLLVTSQPGWVDIWESPALGRHRGMYTWKTQVDGRDAAAKHLAKHGPIATYINTIPLAEWCD